MKAKSMRIPQDIDDAVEFVSNLEKIDKTQSFRKLARIGVEYYLAKAYRESRISLRETSELLGLTLSEAMDFLSEMGVKGNIRAEHLLESLNTLT